MILASTVRRGESEIRKGKEAIKDVLMSILISGAQSHPAGDSVKQCGKCLRTVRPEDEEARVLFPRSPIR